MKPTALTKPPGEDADEATDEAADTTAGEAVDDEQ